jgi:hypothetical protein
MRRGAQPQLLRANLGSGRRWIIRSSWLVGAALLLVAGALPAHAAPGSSAQREPIPVLAYYYIWFDPSSWSRAKTDYPILGRYSSDETEVMRQHIKWAKEAGIDGFIVSWKSTEVLNRRLEKLMEVANEEDFKLSIIYESLDFERQPLPIETVAADLDYFISQCAGNTAFEIFQRPLVIWSGTWEYSRDEVAQVTAGRRGQLLMLASEKNVDGYQRLADIVDGDAYYWSSVNPETFPGYQNKLDDMGKAVHAHGGLWIAPAAPGFDARLVGGSTVVDRKDGQTLRQQMDAAIRASPDVVGIISWNEFSENTHIEPSQDYGTRYLEVLADILGGVAPSATDFDSSEPAATGISYGLPLLGGLVALIAAGLVIVVRRGNRKGATPPAAIRQEGPGDTLS